MLLYKSQPKSKIIEYKSDFVDKKDMFGFGINTNIISYNNQNIQNKSKYNIEEKSNIFKIKNVNKDNFTNNVKKIPFLTNVESTN